jgi:hypothetical protein
MSKYNIPEPLDHSVGMVRTYLHCVDRPRLACFEHELSQLISDDDCMELLTEVLRSRFYNDVILVSGTSHDPVFIDRLEERETVVEKFFATQPHAMETFEREFTAVFEFAFLNIRSDDLS